MTAPRPMAEDLEAVAGLLARARQAVAAGELVDMTPLEAAIERVCAGAAALPAERAAALHPRLLALIDDLGHLARAVETRLEALRQEIGDTAGRHRALSAYGKSGGPKR